MNAQDNEPGGGGGCSGAEGAMAAVTDIQATIRWKVQYPRRLIKGAEEDRVPSRSSLPALLSVLSSPLMQALACIYQSQAPGSKACRSHPYFGKWVRIRVRFPRGSLSFSCLACSRSCRLITVKTERSNVLPNTWAVSYRGRLSQNCGTLQ